MAGIAVVTPHVESTGVASIFCLNEAIREAMGCVKVTRFRHSSFVTFWWSLLVLTAPGTLSCSNYTLWHFSKWWQAYKHCISGLQFQWNRASASSWPQGRREPQQTPIQCLPGISTPGFQEQSWTWSDFI